MMNRINEIGKEINKINTEYAYYMAEVGIARRRGNYAHAAACLSYADNLLFRKRELRKELKKIEAQIDG